MGKVRVALGSLFALFIFGSFLQDPQEIRVEVEAVNLLVTVTDDKGRFVTDLPREEFVILEDGVPQQITNFSRETDLPLKIALLMDTSSSIRLQLDFEKEAAIQFLRSVMHGKDEALLVEFDTGVSMIHDFTSRPTSIIREIEKLRAGGGTALLDAIYTVGREKMIRQEARNILVLVSDGQDQHSRRNLDEALKMAQSSDLVIYTIGTTRLRADHDKKGEKLLSRLAEETGGESFFPYSARQLEQAFERINLELRSQYSLTYRPNNEKMDGKFRRIEARLKNQKNLHVRHRDGYFATPKARETKS